MRTILQRLLDVHAGLLHRERFTDVHHAPHSIVLLAILAGAVWVRFWGLGAVGLHGDEETMAMAVRGILEQGAPYLPSGMLYPRGLAQLYLMAASVWIFGETEWALRLPSALCGLIPIVFAFLAGRRFLRPEWNLAFTAAAAFLPEFVIYSQTARMYIFLVASVAVLLWLTLQWERTGRARFVIAAVPVTLIGIHFHALMLFSALLLLFPPLSRGDLRQLWQAVVALIAIAIGFQLIDGWTAQQYAGLPPMDGASAALVSARAAIAVLRPHALPQLLSAAALAVFFAWMTARRLPSRPLRWTCAILLAAGLAAQLLLSYHLAAVALLAGVVLAVRQGGRKAAAPLTMLAVASVALAIAHGIALHQAGVGPVREIIAAMIGLPSVWPYIQTSQFSKVAVAIAASGFAVALVRLARGGRIADYWLLFVLGVVIPLMAMGAIRWNIPARYTAGVVLPMLLVAFATMQTLVAWLTARRRASPVTRQATIGAAALAGIVIVNPIAFSRTVNSGYSMHPDHKGAAEFVRSLRLTPDDVVLAEDVLQQTYYLGSVDYWLISWNTARYYVRDVNGRALDIYTGTPVMRSADEVAALLKKTKGTVYVVGSGENRSDGRRLMRSDGLFELLQSDRAETLYQGRDGFTKVWKLHASPAVLASKELSSKEKAAR